MKCKYEYFDFSLNLNFENIDWLKNFDFGDCMRVVYFVCNIGFYMFLFF